MKRFIALFLLTVLLCLAVFSSCGQGRSILFSKIESDNEIDSILKDGIVAYTETITYSTEEEPVTLSYYYELGRSVSVGYNVTETAGDYCLVASEGSVYTEKNGILCAVLFSNQTTTFNNFVKTYENPEFELDAGSKFQRSSKTTEDGKTDVIYYADVTPMMEANLSRFGLRADDTIVSEYVLDADGRIVSVVYTAESTDGSIRKLAERDFAYFTERQDPPIQIVDENVNVTLVIGERKFEYTVMSGVYVGFYDDGAGYRYYTDENCTSEYDYLAYGAVTEDLTLYAVKDS